jgi:hypothetical protein
MRKTISIAALLLILILINARSVNARSGCCSHHGGVCGCGCCDGTPLSPKCAPYYPKCTVSRPKSLVKKPQVKKKAVKKVTKKVVKPSPTPTKKPKR